MIDVATLNDIKGRIEGACDRSGRSDSQKIQIVAVTKTLPAEAIESAYDAGLKAVGENRVQEAAEKFPLISKLPGMKRRLVGHLQGNKARKAVELFDTIDSIDSIKLARRLNSILDEKESTKEALLQVNTASDLSKQGFQTHETEAFFEIIELQNLNIKGLMTIGELTSDKSKTRKTFQALRNLKEMLNDSLTRSNKLRDLSMGMTGDFEIAVEEGATMVRLGTALFGSRNR